MIVTAELSAGVNGGTAPIVVIGAGIIGACSALRLAREGRRVLLVDRLEPGSACSFGNAGALSPSAMVPMALPGMLGKVPQWLSDPLGPLAVRWSYLPQALPWLLRWIAESRQERVEVASAALAALNRDTIDGYRELLSPAQFADLVRMTGHLYVYRAKPESTGDRLAQALRDRHGIRSRWLDAREVHELEPRLSDAYTSGMLLPDNGYAVNPQRLVRTLVDNFVEAGGQLLRDEVARLVPLSGGRVTVVTRTASFEAASVVLAGGAWSNELLRPLGCAVPLETERGYHVMLERPSFAPNLPMMIADRKFFLTPMEHGLRIAGTVEIGGLKAAPNWKRANALFTQAKEVFPGLTAHGSSTWMGMRPSMPDSVPMIGRLDRAPGIMLAFGHGHLGMSGGPGTSRLISDLVLGTTPFVDPRPYRADRFRFNRQAQTAATLEAERIGR